MSNHLRLELSKCRIVFFDLEFYVPESNRVNTGLCYNPWDKGSRLLGGSFFVANPKRDIKCSTHTVANNIQSFWLWNYQSEKDLLSEIYELLKNTLSLVHKAHKKKVSPLLCGIGISSSDVPVLIELFKRYKILSNAEAFRFQSNFRVMDLSQLGIVCFNNGNDFLYPKIKNELLNKFMPGTKFESGKSVWDLYESKDYTGITERVNDEIISTHHIYKSLLSEYRGFKRLEKEEKRRIKIAEKVG